MNSVDVDINITINNNINVNMNGEHGATKVCSAFAPRSPPGRRPMIPEPRNHWPATRGRSRSERGTHFRGTVLPIHININLIINIHIHININTINYYKYLIFLSFLNLYYSPFANV